MSTALVGNELTVVFLAQGEQSAEEVAGRLAEFIGQARHSLDIATYDFRLGEPARPIVAGALAERAAAGVDIRIVYDADKPEPPELEAGMDPAPPGTGRFVQALGHPFRRIGGRKLMHHKYLVRDAATSEAAVWTGSMNLTDAALRIQDNNVLVARSPGLAAYYARDFNDLWRRGAIGDTGAFDTGRVSLAFGGERVTGRVLFSPGRGRLIDVEVANLVARARRRVRICSMLLNSGALLAALGDQIRHGPATVDGVYDRTQMNGVLRQWRDVPHNRWKISAVEDIVAGARLVGKKSTPYAPDRPHDFMHNKVLVVDDTVITGSHNFSRSAEKNAENVLILRSRALAGHYSAYIDHLMGKYSDAPKAKPRRNPQVQCGKLKRDHTGHRLAR